MLPATPLPLTQQLAPANAADVAAVVRDAYESQTAVYPIGGGTSLEMGLTARHPGIGLSLSEMSAVVDYPARDMTITVEAGIRLAALAELLASQGQRLPVDGAQADQATLGGLIASNFSGPRRFGHGTIRDYVIGISAIDGRGTPFKGGGRVVKNVAGYDFCKLLCGSFGTLAVITQVTLKLKPLAPATALLVAHVDDLAQAESLLAALVNSDTVPTAVELLSGPAWQSDAILTPAGASAAAYVAVGFEGTAAEVDWMVGKLRREWQQLGMERILSVPPINTAAIWTRLTEFPVAADDQVVIKANLVPSAVTPFVRELTAAVPDCSVQAHAANGIVLARIPKMPAGDVSQLLLKRCQPQAMGVGGNIVVLSSPENLEPTRRLIWGGARDDAPLMQAVKNQFDPRGLLNPGRFVYNNA